MNNLIYFIIVFLLFINPFILGIGFINPYQYNFFLKIAFIVLLMCLFNIVGLIFGLLLIIFMNGKTKYENTENYSNYRDGKNQYKKGKSRFF
tara:strand:- start:3644 stop:3919 length:276 start_codon:yes stop_codon:yes gene_type:complete